ncbi:hypothetical protein EJ06DRAFT_579474 [Trichodelitschia bisporula]|uniref:Uncharacterized protein n=1 Tax=Trichodelitschia bisporula TaxID=703511 RepID=A0A6G1I574_9PEZI|nr:hypothetical protein EJ06DRAFT_579474 [Trichodelitschia bisporula]
MSPRSALRIALAASCAFFAALTSAVSDDVPASYKYGDLIPVTCLNRTIDTGEHITDPTGNLQYIPFPSCLETQAPLSLPYLHSTPQRCTITLTDPLFHLLEFYIHNDAPLTCRIASSPPAGSSTTYTPLTLALAGTLQLSHLHVAQSLNLAVHIAPRSSSAPAPGAITAAAGYSIAPTANNTRVVIGDELPLTFHVRWYTSPTLPVGGAGTRSTGGWATLAYCVFSAAASAAVCVVYFRGVELPRRLRWHGRERMGGGGGLPKYNGYGYGVAGAANGASGNGYGGYGFGVTGKRD